MPGLIRSALRITIASRVLTGSVGKAVSVPSIESRDLHQPSPAQLHPQSLNPKTP